MNMELIGDSMAKSKDDITPDEWEKLTSMAEEFNARQTAKAPEVATNFYKSALEVQQDFGRRIQTIESGGGEMEQKEFEKWEDALSNEIGYAKNELQRTDGSLDTIADCEQAMIFSTNDDDLHKTIEAQAGKFYLDRMSALREAIQASDDEKAKSDLEYAKGFYPAVMKHLDFKYMSDNDVRSYGYDQYDLSRTIAHNNAIKHLNGINDLAKKYHVRPFTIRNFWPSDIRSKKDQTPAVSKVMYYDRKLVEEYYDIAFSSEIERIKRSQEMKTRYYRQ